MTFEILGIDHVVLRVADQERAIAFYEGVLGAKVERRSEKIGLVQLRAGRSLIDLIEAPAGKTTGGRNMDHFALRIEPFDEAAIRAHLGHTIDDHQAHLGRLCSRLSAVAAENPYAWFQTALSPDDITNITSDNRWVCSP